MLGEKIGAFEGKITGQRVLPPEGECPKFEATAEISGTILNSTARMIATYWSLVRPDGSLYGECPGQSVTITQDGDMGRFMGTGAGRFTGQGSAVSFRGAIYYQGATGKLARLNGLAIVYEWDVDQHGNCQFHLWEWK
jgi:hypothetical protein